MAVAEPNTAAEFAAAARAVKSEAELAELHRRLREDVDGFMILSEMAKSRSVNARMWVVWAAPESIPDRAKPILMKLARDRDPDVRSEAIKTLAKLDPDAAKSLLPQLRRDLQSTDFYAPSDAMWTIARLGLREAIPDIREAAKRWPPETDGQGRIAEIVLDFLEGRHTGILLRIRGHDHVAMPWLARAARWMHTKEADEALAWGAQAYVGDRTCETSCANLLGDV